MADTLNIIGLVLGILAGWALAYPLLWGYPKRNRRLIAETQLRSAEDTLKYLKVSTDTLPDPPYSEEDKAGVMREYLKRLQPDIDALTQEIKTLGEGHEEKSFYLSGLGIMLLTVGFAAQLWAVLRSAPPRPQPATETLTWRERALPPFEDASTDEPAALRKDVCLLRQDLRNTNSNVVLVVGRYDARPLSLSARGRFFDNAGLAQQRAEKVKTLLMEGDGCPAPPVAHVVAVPAGPRITNIFQLGRQSNLSIRLEPDRKVEVYWFSYAMRATTREAR